MRLFPETPKNPAQSSSNIKLACIATPEAFSRERVPTTAPADAFPDTVKLLKPNAIKLSNEQSRPSSPIILSNCCQYRIQEYDNDSGRAGRSTPLLDCSLRWL